MKQFETNIANELKKLTGTPFTLENNKTNGILNLRNTKTSKIVLVVQMRELGAARTRDFLDIVKNNLPEYFL